jgi:hypothetical protein
VARRTGKFRWAKAGPWQERLAGKAARLESEPCATFCPATFCRVACATGPAAHSSPHRLSAESRMKMRGAERCSAVRRRRLASDAPTAAAVARSAGILPAGAGASRPCPVMAATAMALGALLRAWSPALADRGVARAFSRARQSTTRPAVHTAPHRSSARLKRKMRKNGLSPVGSGAPA